MYLLGFDIGSSSVKVSLLDANKNDVISSASYPKTEMKIDAPHTGWAEQNPEDWWNNLKLALSECISKVNIDKSQIKAIGISYQMHGLVCVDENQNVLRPSIIWCDSRAVTIGEKAFQSLGNQYCLEHLLNSPGNFTASKLRWVKENQIDIFNKIHKIMLPGDFIAMKLTGEINTTASGLSEGVFWDFKENNVSKKLLAEYEIPERFIPNILPTFSNQGSLNASAAKELGLHTDIIVAYRAGDQPNNAFSLNVLNAGEVATTAGTSGVVYAISDSNAYDTQSRVNTFLHVNHSENQIRNGVLLCINGTGIQNSWLKNTLFNHTKSYEELNTLAESIKIGSDGLKIYPFGNGSERVLGNKVLGGSITNINFNLHTQSHIARAVQEGIVFGLNYGFEVMKNMGISPKKVKAGKANMFLSNVFAQTFANCTETIIDLYNTDGAAGAARGAGLGVGFYKNTNEAFSGLVSLKTIEPNTNDIQASKEVYEEWKSGL